MKRLKKKLMSIGLTAVLLACCSVDKSKEASGNAFDESNLSEGEKMILAAIAEYDFKRVTVLSDSLQNTGDISAVTANYYHGAALTHSGMVRSATRWHHNLLQLRAVQTHSLLLSWGFL